MSNIVNDVSILTTISEKTIEKLLQKFVYAICEQIAEDILEEKDYSELDIGLGKLYVKIIGEEIKYKFVPSNYLQSAISNVVTNKLNLMENTLNETLVKRFMDVYKNLC